MKILVSEKQEKTIIKKFMKENKKKMIENRLSDLIKKGLNTGEIKLAASALFDDVSRKKINKLDSNVELRKLLKIYSSDILNSFKLFENDIKTEMNKTIEEIITNYKNVRIENKNIINDYHNNIKKFISDNNISFIETYSDNKIVVYNINCMGKKIYDINSGFRVFSKKTITKYFDYLSNHFSFTTSSTLIYLLNNKSIAYYKINYLKREGNENISKVKLFRDSLRTLQYICEGLIFFNPLKFFFIISLFFFILFLFFLNMYLIFNFSIIKTISLILFSFSLLSFLTSFVSVIFKKKIN
jgi:hypothetical protein